MYLGYKYAIPSTPIKLISSLKNFYPLSQTSSTQVLVLPVPPLPLINTASLSLTILLACRNVLSPRVKKRIKGSNTPLMI